MSYKGGEILEQNFKKLENSMQEEFPTYRAAFGYGSGIVPQTGYDYSKETPLMDILMVVDDVYEWHAQNWRQNRHHYSGIPFFTGAPFVSFLSKSIFPVTFFPDIELRSGL